MTHLDGELAPVPRFFPGELAIAYENAPVYGSLPRCRSHFNHGYQRRMRHNDLVIILSGVTHGFNTRADDPVFPCWVFVAGLHGVGWVHRNLLRAL